MEGEKNKDNSSSSSLLLHEAATSAQPDLGVQLLFYVFSAAAFFQFACIVLGAFPYFQHHAPYFLTEYGLAGSASAACTLYVGLAYLAAFPCYHKVPGALLTLMVLWGVALGLTAGFLAAHLKTLAPIQFFVLCFAQSMGMVAYTRWSPRYLELYICVLIMFVSNVLGWLDCLYGFIVDVDWIEAGVIFTLGTCVVMYNTLYITRIEERYDASWEQGVLATANYFCEDLSNVIKKIAK